MDLNQDRNIEAYYCKIVTCSLSIVQCYVCYSKSRDPEIQREWSLAYLQRKQKRGYPPILSRKSVYWRKLLVFANFFTQNMYLQYVSFTWILSLSLYLSLHIHIYISEIIYILLSLTSSDIPEVHIPDGLPIGLATWFRIGLCLQSLLCDAATTPHKDPGVGTEPSQHCFIDVRHIAICPSIQCARWKWIGNVSSKTSFFFGLRNYITM